MSCRLCPKKKRTLPDGRIVLEFDNSEWGPQFWKVLHCLAARVGNVSNTIKDQSTDFFCVINYLGKVLPCKICQRHYTDYLHKHRITWSRTFKDGRELRMLIQKWLFELHNYIRLTNEHEIQVKTIEECTALYSSCRVSESDIQPIVDAVSNAVKIGIVKYDEAKRWLTCFRRLIINVN